MKILSFFSIFMGHFCPPGSRSGSAICMRIRIRIQQLKLMRIHADLDPDPKPWFKDNMPLRSIKNSRNHGLFETALLSTLGCTRYNAKPYQIYVKQRSGAEVKLVNSPYKRKCWINSVFPLHLPETSAGANSPVLAWLLRFHHGHVVLLAVRPVLTLPITLLNLLKGLCHEMINFLTVFAFTESRYRFDV